MKILTVDIGNSNIVIGCVNDHKVAFVERMNSDRSKTDLEYVIGCKMVLDLHNVPVDIDRVLLSSLRFQAEKSYSIQFLLLLYLFRQEA